MKTTDEIQQIKDLIAYFHREKICPKASALYNLFNGRAEGYIKAMESLGGITIENGEIVDLAGIRG